MSRDSTHIKHPYWAYEEGHCVAHVSNDNEALACGFKPKAIVEASKDKKVYEGALWHAKSLGLTDMAPYLG